MSKAEARTVLLARPGESRDRLRAALEQAGVELVLMADPLEVGIDEVAGADARNLVIAVDAEVEDALDRFDALLSDDRYRILFEETAVVNLRDGWDVARWSRHLGAKLLGHGDVLPDGHEPDDLEGEPVQAVRAASVEPPAAELPAVEASAAALEQSEEIPAEISTVGDIAEPAFEGEIPATKSYVGTAEPVEFEYDEDAATYGAALPDASAVPGASESEIPEDAAGDWMRFQDFEATDELPSANVPHALQPEYRAALAPLEANELADDQAYERIGQEFERFGGDTPADRWQDYERPAAEALEPSPGAASAPPEVPKPPSEWGLSDDPLYQASQSVAQQARDARLEALESRISSLSLVAPEGDEGTEVETSAADPASYALESDASQSVDGAVVLLGGIGGPDPLRQVLQNLAPGMSVPVLVQQWLDGGHYDRLVRQMDRASQMPVHLAEVGAPLAPGHAYIVPVSIGVDRDSQGVMRFIDAPARGFADVLASLSAAASGVVLLSGTREEFVEPVLRFQQAGGRVFAQSSEGCYDHAVPALMISRGADAQLPAGIAPQIAARWQQQAQA